MTITTTHTNPVAALAAAARPCAADHGNQWRARMDADTSLGLMYGNSTIKRTARRLGEAAT
jgi:hypothetical protein